MSKSRKRIWILSCAGVLLILAGAFIIYTLTKPKTVHRVHGSLIPISFAEMCQESEAVVLGTVKERGEIYQTDGGLRYTPVTVTVQEVIKGEQTDELTYMEPYAETENDIYYIYPMEIENVPIKTGVTAVFFLMPRAEGQEPFGIYYCGIYEETDGTVKVGESEGISTRSAGEKEEMSIQDFRKLVLEHS